MYPKAIICSVFLVVEVTCCGVLVVGIQSFLSAGVFQFSIILTIDILRIRYLNCQPFLAELWPTCGVRYVRETDLVASYSNCCDGVE